MIQDGQFLTSGRMRTNESGKQHLMGLLMHRDGVFFCALFKHLFQIEVPLLL